MKHARLQLTEYDYIKNAFFMYLYEGSGYPLFRLVETLKITSPSVVERIENKNCEAAEANPTNRVSG